jgi:hypothetical protein
MMGKVYWGAHGAVNDQASPFALFLGDSWFWYPVGNLPTYIAPAFADDIVVIGRNGAEAQEWATRQRKEIDFAFKMYARDVKALVLSGGGNDIAGTADFLRILAENCSRARTVAQCYRDGQPGDITLAITSAYRQVIAKFRFYNKNAPVLAHNYDFAWPTGEGLFGPADWLKKPMELARVPDRLRKDLLKDLLLQLRAAQLELANDASIGNFVAIESGGTMPDDGTPVDQWWANELHPTPKGWKLLCRKAFIPALKQVITP